MECENECRVKNDLRMLQLLNMLGFNVLRFFLVFDYVSFKGLKLVHGGCM